MEGRKQVAVIGGDARQAAAGRALARAGYAVCGAEQVALADYILLPLPLDETRTPLAELLRAAKPGALALGGRLSAQAKQIAQEAGVELVDYFAREELTIRNAIPTAEGCLGSSDLWLGIPVKWPHISAARVIVEVTLKNYRVDPSQGTHFFQNLTSFGVGYFTVDENRGDGFFGKSELDAMPSVMETEHVRVVRFARPLKIMMDGKRQEGAVLRR